MRDSRSGSLLRGELRLLSSCSGRLPDRSNATIQHSSVSLFNVGGTLVGARMREIRPGLRRSHWNRHDYLDRLRKYWSPHDHVRFEFGQKHEALLRPFFENKWRLTFRKPSDPARTIKSEERSRKYNKSDRIATATTSFPQQWPSFGWSPFGQGSESRLV